ncbi:hypothetical protein [Cetobacterium sp.]|uniref:hypothetical protein n=1 Tax=Cetobacterium sp. TaxID=2071632 RepID=UPI003F3268CB
MVKISKEEYIKKELINSYGENFENLFIDIIRKHQANFVKISAYGNLGDRKNDGYIKGQGIFFQVYGPKELTNSSAKNAIKKMKVDFEELKKHCDNDEWEKLKKYNFVYNDKDFGVSPELEKIRSDISKEFKIDCEILGINKIISLFNSLSEEDKDSIVNFVQGDSNVNNDLKIYKILKEVFYDSGLVTKLENFYFGRSYDWEYFDTLNKFNSGDYAEYLVQDIYFYFKNEEYEELKLKFLYNYIECLSFLSLNYFLENNNTLILSEYTRVNSDDFSKKTENFENLKNEAVKSIKILLQLYHKKEIK